MIIINGELQRNCRDIHGSVSARSTFFTLPVSIRLLLQQGRDRLLNNAMAQMLCAGVGSGMCFCHNLLRLLWPTFAAACCAHDRKSLYRRTLRRLPAVIKLCSTGVGLPAEQSRSGTACITAYRRKRWCVIATLSRLAMYMSVKSLRRATA